ncbi:hypothetical protein B566_EDAN002120 [Ephemera danica]|nr:hypothetical protein B566_EDAN002120 [Ephemera danica]
MSRLAVVLVVAVALPVFATEHFDEIRVAKKLGDKCVAYIQCQVAFGEEAECIQRECRCVAGSHFAEGLCHTSVTIGGRCAGRSDCYSASSAPVSCVHSVCQCHQDYHPNVAGNDCVRSIGLGGTCTKNEECVTNNSMCYNTCSCQASFVPSSDKQRCLPALGGVCEVSQQCRTASNVPNSVQCDPNTKRCVCSPGYVATRDDCRHLQCLKFPQL